MFSRVKSRILQSKRACLLISGSLHTVTGLSAACYTETWPGISILFLLHAYSLFLFLRLTLIDPGYILPRSEDYKRNVVFNNCQYRIVEANGHTVARVISTKEKTTIEAFCHFCKIFKPVDTAHCRDCKKCVMQMDHHCPWMANCVGARNYAEFLCFLTVELARSIFILCLRFRHMFPVKKWEFVPAISFSPCSVVSCLSGVQALAHACVFVFLWGYFMTLLVRGTSSRKFCLGRKYAPLPASAPPRISDSSLLPPEYIAG